MIKLVKLLFSKKNAYFIILFGRQILIKHYTPTGWEHNLIEVYVCVGLSKPSNLSNNQTLPNHLTKVD